MTRHPRRLVTIAVLATLVLATACGGGSDEDTDAAVTGTLSVTLTLAADQVAAGAAIPLTVTVRNESGDTLTVARPALVPSMVYLAVTRDGGDVVPFDGPWPRLRPLTADAFVELAAGESVEHAFDLADWYTLPAGTYSIVASYHNEHDGSQLGLSALVIDAADELPSSAVALEVQ